MGYLAALETDHLPLPSDPNYWVRMKQKAGYGDILAARSAMLKITQSAEPVDPGEMPEMLTEMEFGAYVATLVSRLVVEWNVTDLTDRVLPITAATINQLSPEDGEFLTDEAQKRIGTRPKVQRRPFPKPSGRGSTASRRITRKRSG